MKQFRNDELAEAFRKWIEEARTFLRDKPLISKAGSDVGRRLVIHREPGRSLKEEVIVPQSPSGLFYDYREEIPTLTSYGRVVDVLRTSPGSKELTGKFVGTSAGAFLVQWEPEILFALTDRLVIQTGAVDAQQLALSPNADLRMTPIHQRTQILNRASQLFF